MGMDAFGGTTAATALLGVITAKAYFISRVPNGGCASAIAEFSIGGGTHAAAAFEQA